MSNDIINECFELCSFLWWGGQEFLKCLEACEKSQKQQQGEKDESDD